MQVIGSRPGIFLWLLLVLAACTSNSLRHIVVAESAFDLTTKQLGDGEYQIGYKVKLPYPETAIGTQEFQRLAALGWTRCRGSATGDWESYADFAGGTGRGIHQRMAHWVKGDMIVTIAMLYYSDLKANQVEAAEPRDATQHIFVTVLGGRERQVKELKLRCGE